MIIALCDGVLMSVSKTTYQTRNNEKEQVRGSLIKRGPVSLSMSKYFDGIVPSIFDYMNH